MTAIGTIAEHDATRGMNLIRLEWIRRRLAERTEIAELCAVATAAGALAGPVLIAPRFGRWLTRLVRLLDRHAAELLPDGDFRATCAEAAVFTAAVRCLDPAAAAETTIVRVGADGVVPLPGTGIRLAFPLAYAGVTVPVRAAAIDPLRVEVDLPPGAELGPVVVHHCSEPPGDADTEETSGEAATACVSRSPRTSMSAQTCVLRWTAAGGRMRKDLQRVKSMPGPIAELQTVLAELGCPGGIPINGLSDQKQRADASFDHLSLLQVRHPERYRSVVARIDSAPDSDLRRLLKGHIAYVEHDMRSAAEAYVDLLIRHPHDVDLWRDLTFAVRHLGDPVPGETWLFHPADVIARAEACAPDPAPLARLLPSFSRYEDMSPACRFAIGLVEWVRNDLDPR